MKIALLKLFTAAVAGDSRGLRRALIYAKKTHSSDASIREVLRMVHLFAGFPRSISAFEAFAEVSTGPKGDRAAPDRASLRAGRKVFDTIYQHHSAAVRRRLAELDPVLARWIERHAYARVLTRGGLDLAERECLAVAALAVTRQDRQLVSHVYGALRAGASASDVEAALRVGTHPLAPADRARVLRAARDVLKRSTVRPSSGRMR